MTLADHLKQPGRTFTEWAAMAGVSVATVSRWAAGQSKPDHTKADELSRKLGLPKHVLRPDIWKPEPAEAAQ